MGSTRKLAHLMKMSIEKLKVNSTKIEFQTLKNSKTNSLAQQS